MTNPPSQMPEFEQAKIIADRVLDKPYADPDSDESIVARQFLRLCEQTRVASVPSDKERAEASGIEYDTPEIAALIFSEWKKIKPSKLAQEIRSRIKIDSGKNRHSPEADLMPSWVWNIADIAAQMALDNRTLAAPDQSEGFYGKACARLTTENKQKDDTIKALVAALERAKSRFNMMSGCERNGATAIAGYTDAEQALALAEKARGA